MTSKPRHLLIDGDVIAYQICASKEEEIEYGDIAMWYSSKSECVEACLKRVEGFMKTLDAETCTWTFSGPENYRKDIWPDYKGNRVQNCCLTSRIHKAKPLALKGTREALIERTGAGKIMDMIPRVEGDDILGILSTSPKFMPDHEKIIVSIDKDFATIPGYFYSIKDKELFHYTEDEADRNLYVQALTGDKVDGYPGLEGYGPVKANKELEGYAAEELLDIYLDLYEEKGYSKEYALVQLQCARILRHEDWDKEERKPILFQGVPNSIELAEKITSD